MVRISDSCADCKQGLSIFVCQPLPKINSSSSCCTFSRFHYFVLHFFAAHCILPLVPRKNINHIKISANPTNTTLVINIDLMSILRPYVEKKISTYFQVGSTYFFDVTSMGKKSRRFDVLCST